MIKVLGFADTMAGLILLAKIWQFEIPATMFLFFAGYLIIKGVIFMLNSLDIGSAGDVAAGILLAASAFSSPPAFLLGVFAIFLIGKGLLSLFA